MKLKVSQGVYLNENQTKEIYNLFIEPYDSETVELKKGEKTGVYNAIFIGDYGTYHYRVNKSFELITLQKVKGRN